MQELQLLSKYEDLTSCCSPPRFYHRGSFIIEKYYPLAKLAFFHLMSRADIVQCVRSLDKSNLHFRTSLRISVKQLEEDMLALTRAF